MLRIFNERYRNSLFITIISLFAASACSTVSDIKKQKDITIERVDSKGANIRHAYLTLTENQLSLRGNIERRLSGRGPIPGHLHITLIDPQGKAIKEADIGYMRRNVKSSIAHFNVMLPVDLTPGSTVKITHFSTKTHQTFSDITTWRNSQ